MDDDCLLYAVHNALQVAYLSLSNIDLIAWRSKQRMSIEDASILYKDNMSNELNGKSDIETPKES